MAEDSKTLKDLREELLLKVRRDRIKKLIESRTTPRPFQEARSTEEISELLGCTRASTHHIIRKFGITPVGGVKMKSGCTTWWDPEDFRKAFLKGLGEDPKGKVQKRKRSHKKV